MSFQPPTLSDDDLKKLYTWIDEIPLSRPKRNIARDFSDGVLCAEVIHHYFPKLVDLHNYSPSGSLRNKMYNWSTLNQKTLKRIGYQLKPEEIEAVVNCTRGMIESILMTLQDKMAKYRAKRRQRANGAASSDAGSSAAGTPPAHARDHHHQSPRTASLHAPSPSTQQLTSAHQQPHPSSASQRDQAALLDALQQKDATVQELRDTVEILELKIQKLEQLVRLKDSRIQTLTARIQSQAGGPAPHEGTHPRGIADHPTSGGDSYHHDRSHY